MPALASDLRKTLENTVVKARDKAEGGARDALTALAVGASEPFGSMSEEERKLRNRLRAHGRQLGDQRDPQKGTQSIERLVREMAYEHWHRMLFARFLAENQLLMEPSSGVSISLDECEELAAEEGTDLWGLAAQYAQAMLPQIFRGDDPVLAAKLPLEIRQQLQGLVAGLDTETFTASDSLGWTYQFWQTKRKKEVNDSGVKIGADELSPVTQLFTEDYMVDFLLDNTLGAWHAGKVLAANPQLAATAQSEEELRQAVALQGCPWNYLRFIKTDDGPWAPASGTYEGWPKTAAELKCLDPCMGSGHFVVAMFERLVALRIAEEAITEQAAVAAVVEVNLFGLEIDPRCTQIGAFNLALAAWRHVGYCPLPAMNLACSGLAPNTSEAAWLTLAGDNERLRNGMARLYRLFEKASVLGSLINPRMDEADLLEAGFQELQPLLEQALFKETNDESSNELSVIARGLAKAAEILAKQFTLVATNVPYLARGKQDEILKNFLDIRHSNAKQDLAAVFVERCFSLASNRGGTVASVTPHYWLFLQTYKDFRRDILSDQTIQGITRLGANAFETISGEVVNVCLLVATKDSPMPGHLFAAIDASTESSVSAKCSSIISGAISKVEQQSLLSAPDHRITFETYRRMPLLSEVAKGLHGQGCFDVACFVASFWEVDPNSGHWELQQTTAPQSAHYAGCSGAFRWENGTGLLRDLMEHKAAEGYTSGKWKAGVSAWGRRAVAISGMTRLLYSQYIGRAFDENVSIILPESEELLPAIWCYCESGEFEREVRKVDQKFKVTCNTLVKVPFAIEHWQEVANEKYPNGLPKPFSSDAKQWLFSGHPAGADQPLHVAVARLVGYEWPRQTGSSFPDCPALGPDGLETLTDEDGIVCLAPVRGEASAVERLRKLLATSLGDEWSTAKERELLLATAVDNNAKKPEPDLESWLRSSFFSEHCKLFQSRPFIWQIWDGCPHGFSALVNYHKLAAPNGQGRKTLELLAYTYLGDWIDRQKLDQAEGVNGADDRLAAALDLQGQLKKILDGEAPYDIFVRWKPLHQQAIGWDPDINDGVRLNIRPFLSAQLRKGCKTGAGILRAKPGTIKWAKDRGKEPMRSKDDFPWFWGWDENDPEMNPSDQTKCANFGAPTDITVDQGHKPRYDPVPAGVIYDGNRWNDLHYTRAAKEATRARQEGKQS
jgi:hypothetical protein